MNYKPGLILLATYRYFALLEQFQIVKWEQYLLYFVILVRLSIFH